MTKTLLMDAFPIRLSLDEGTNGKLVARGEFGRADLATQNGRVYPRAIYEREIKKLQENVSSRRVFGELDHPADGKTKLQRASHVITKLSINEDGIVVGEAEILDTPNGRTLKAILEASAEVGVSSRGFGSTKQASGGQQVVGEDFMLRTFDFVADPAMKSAYPGIFTEDIDEDFMSASSLEESFPELAQQLRKDERERVEKALSMMLDQQQEVAEESMKVKLRDEFGRRLVEQMSALREDVEGSVRDELCEDPEVAGAKAVLGKIAEMVSVFSASCDPDMAALQDALKAKDLEVSKIAEDLDHAKGVARQAIFRAQMETTIGGHSRHDSIVELIGDPSSFESLDELRERIEVVMSEMDDLGEVAESSLAGENEELRGRLKSNLANFKSDRQKYKAQIEELTDQLEQALTVGESLRVETEKAQRLAEESDLRAYKAEGTRGHTNSSRLMDLLEGVDNLDAVDRIIKNSGSRRVKDSNLESVRNRLRGTTRDASKALNEEKERQVGPSSVFGDMSMGDFMSLAGINSGKP